LIKKPVSKDRPLYQYTPGTHHVMNFSHQKPNMPA
jgi:hypothetical protein